MELPGSSHRRKVHEDTPRDQRRRRIATRGKIVLKKDFYRLRVVVGFVFGLFLSGYGLFVACKPFGTIDRQMRSTDFSETTAEVIHSRTVQVPGEEKKIERPDIRIRYWIGIESETRESTVFDRVFHTPHAQRMINEYPVGRRFGVYYNETNPDEFVVTRGLRGVDLFDLMCSTAICVVIVGGWIGLCGMTRSGMKRDRRTYNLPTDVKEVRLSAAVILAGGVYMLTGAPLVIYFYAKAYTDISIETVLTNWLIMLVSSIVVLCWQCIPRCGHKKRKRRGRRTPDPIP